MAGTFAGIQKDISTTVQCAIQPDKPAPVPPAPRLPNILPSLQSHPGLKSPG